jgi:hypothetical protein
VAGEGLKLPSPYFSEACEEVVAKGILWRRSTKDRHGEEGSVNGYCG